MPYQKVRTLSSVTAAYIAGLIDGEGTIALTREHSNENRRLVVSISNTEMAILRFVKVSVGPGKITNKRIYSKRHTPSFAYKITNQQALALLKRISIYLQSYKRLRAEFVLKGYTSVTPRNGRYTSEQRKARKRFEKSFLDILP